MQINVITQSVGVEETLGSCTAEQPIDADITLPDYCPDIRRVLKCLVTPRITAVQTAGDRATADGSAGVCVIYADEQDCAARVMQRNQLNEHEAAKRIKHVDRMRKKYFACYADSEWGQPESYDLMLSSSKFGIDGCVELILGSLAQMKGEASVE